ncbi:hypothetical protein [Hymenobacter sp. IS2118]|uniref:hypothetical protein n=1 Tax=Hymenobacter sp. IS2118 TaxID=1505605 RepID=UPI000B2871ED|nr:hypothetical protein [Hymenobacter sp. IS2118]
MSTNPIEDNSTPKPTGSLEDLFRHHLGEEAAVPPRPMLWDQIDNSLLVRQNETYRRRLAATRWVAAASLLLATLAGTGWWASHTAEMTGAEVATTIRTPQATTGNIPSGPSRADATQAGNNAAESMPANASVSASSSAATRLANRGTAADTPARGTYAATMAAAAAERSARRSTGFGPAAARTGLGNGPTAAGRGAGTGTGVVEIPGNGASGTVYSAANGGTELAAARTTQADATETPAPGGADRVYPAALPATEAALATAATGSTLVAGSAAGLGAASASAALATAGSAAAVAGPEAVGLLAARPAALSLSGAAALPHGLAALAIPAEEPALALATSKWRFGGTYTVGAFNPNINFSRAGIETEYPYNPALGPDSPALTEAAATQYRENLQAGLSQRLALVVKRHLTGNWSLSTGLSLSQATAQSASTSAFVGEQLIDLGRFTNGKMYATDFRYRVAGIPVEASYNNPLKRGWSLYGRLGGAVNALLSVRSEVAGSPEATKTYSIASAGGPYRRLLASVQGGAGAQFRPGSGLWAFTLGPVAEMNLLTLNANPAQGYLRQSRAYTFGLEAGLEFGH